MSSTNDSPESCIVTVNTGSTSVKLAAFTVGAAADADPVEHAHYTDAAQSPEEVLRSFCARLPGPLRAIAHRIVHGGTRFDAPVRIDKQVIAALDELSALAPLHNPKALEWIQAAQSVAGPDVAQIAVFDTSFFFRMPRIAAHYAVAPHWVELGVKRYGFHGLAHEALYKRWAALHPRLPDGGKVITLQLGRGCSIAAIDRGHPVDTSMGFSPLEGLVMATRSGDLDPAVVPYLEKRLNSTAERVVERLNRESGLAGMTGGGTELAELATGADSQQFAFDLYCYRIRKYVGAYLAVLGGCDGIVFGGGVGEHVPQVRSRALAGLEWAGIGIDATANSAARGQEARIDAGGAVSVYVIPVQEESVLRQAALELTRG